jgi:hypothetical protein
LSVLVRHTQPNWRGQHHRAAITLCGGCSGLISCSGGPSAKLRHLADGLVSFW